MHSSTRSTERVSWRSLRVGNAVEGFVTMRPLLCSHRVLPRGSLGTTTITTIRQSLGGRPPSTRTRCRSSSTTRECKRSRGALWISNQSHGRLCVGHSGRGRPQLATRLSISTHTTFSIVRFNFNSLVLSCARTVNDFRTSIEYLSEHNQCFNNASSCNL